MNWQAGFAWPLAVVAGVFLLFFLFNPGIIADWRVYSFDDGTYSHAYLIPFVAAWFYWSGWRQGQLRLRWSPLFFVLFLGSLLLFQWLMVAQQAFLSRLVLPLVPALALATLFRLTPSLLVPVSFLWFVTPIWGVLSGVLQRISVIAVNKIMTFTSVPTYVEGDFVHIPSGTFEIAGGCSGLRYVIVAVFLVIAFCFMNLRRKRSMLLFAAVAIAGAMITNWVRIALLIYIGHATDMQSSLVEDHNTFGWYIFLPFLVLLFYFGTRLEPPPPLPTPLAPAGSRPVLPVAVVALALVVFSGVAIHWQQSGTLRWVAPIFDVESEQAASAALPQPTPVVYAWTRRAVDEIDAGGVRIVRQHYEFAGETDAHKADFYLNDPVPRGWAVIRSEQTASEARMLLTAADGEQAVIVYAYGIGEQRTPDRGRLRQQRLLEALALNSRTELLWAVADCGAGGCDEVYRKLGEESGWLESLLQGHEG